MGGAGYKKNEPVIESNVKSAPASRTHREGWRLGLIGEYTPIQEGSHCLAPADCCHAGSMLRLPNFSFPRESGNLIFT